MLRNTFAWSKSRADKFERCPRAYYYHYHGSWGGWARTADPLAQRLYALKHLQTVPMWVGGAVHQAVDRLLARAEQGDPVAVEAAVEGMQQWMVRRGAASSAAVQSGQFLAHPKRTFALLEHYYGRAVDLAAASEQGAAALRRAFDTWVYAEVAGGSARRLALGPWPSTTVGGVQVIVQIDLAYRRDGQLVLVDWKTGRGGAFDQLAVYGLYAAQELGQTAIELVEANLQRGTLEAWRVDERLLAHARQYVQDSAAALQGLDPARLEAFPRRPGACPGCPFLEVCA